MGFLFFSLGHAPGEGLGGAGVKYFSKHGHVAYQIEGGWLENNTSKGLTGDLMMGSKGQIIINFNFKVSQFQRFYAKLCVFLTNKRYKTYRTEFSFCRLGHAPGEGLGVLGH